MTTADHELPELTFALAREIGTFGPFPYTIAAEQVAEYERLTGDANELHDRFVPPGFAAIFGRLGYLRRHRMPPGGVLLAQDIQWHRPASVGDELTVGSRVVSAVEAEGRRKLVFETTAADPDGPVCTVVLTCGWPK